MRYVSRLAVAALMVFGIMSVSSVAAQDTATQTFTLQPGGRATVDFEAFCVDFGKDFPENVSAPSGLANDDVRNALYYSLENGLTESDPVQVQAAIWSLSEGDLIDQAGDSTQQILDNIDGVTIADLGATSVVDAVKSGDVELTIDSWDAAGETIDLGTVNDNYYGKGRLTLVNKSDAAVTLAMPVGTLFQAGQETDQDMAGYATNVEVSNPVETLPETSAFNTGALWFVVLGFALIIASRLVRRSARLA